VSHPSASAAAITRWLQDASEYVNKISLHQNNSFDALEAALKYLFKAKTSVGFFVQALPAVAGFFSPGCFGNTAMH
jgi:hypothetical protein